jgi:ribosomal protein S18 acetylase RimI-like enzyme
MNSEITILKAGIHQIPIISSLANEVWPDAYRNILSVEQLDYMLDLIYSNDSLQRQMTNEQQRFLLIYLAQKPVGFAAFSMVAAPATFKLHKLYVRTDLQGSGLGKALLDEVEEQVKQQNGTALLLNVNRHNKAKSFYEKHGFVVIKEEDIDIGKGYFMNDYVMEKRLI